MKAKTKLCEFGILSRFDMSRLKPAGQQTNFIIECIEAGKKFGLDITVIDISRNSDVREGVVLRDGKWRRVSLSPPVVLYDRFYSSMTGFDPEFEARKDILSSTGRFINPLAFARDVTDKVVFGNLMNAMGVASPAFYVVKGNFTEVFIEAMRRWRGVVIKPVFGRMGKNIIRVRATGKRIQVGFGDRSVYVDTLGEALGGVRWIVRRSGLNMESFLVQAMVPAGGPAGRHFDVRCLVQRFGVRKDAVGVTGMVARVSSGARAAPNLDQGGLAMEINRWLETLYGESTAAEMTRKIHEVSLDIYRKLEEKYGSIGEMGLDFLVDTHGKIWIIEINSKPGRMVFNRLAEGFGLSPDEKSSFKELRRKAVENPVRYGGELLEEMRDDEK